MLLSEPNRTSYDLNFQLGKIPVRIHPAFFILPVFWGASTGSGLGVVIFILVFFLSILVHELGHALLMMRFGEAPRIVLYWMGGLAISDGSAWGGFRRRSGARSTWESILVSFAGPAAGFLLAALAMGIVIAIGARIDFAFYGLPVFTILPEGSVLDTNRNLHLLFHILIFINVYFNLLNLAPVFPLDGGQIARAIFVHYDPWRGIVHSLWLSLIVAALIALALGAGRQTFGMIFFGLLALQSFQAIQMSGTGGFGGGRPW